ncbi:MAG: universal stress protein [Gaiellaceae bacterium]
MRSILIATDGSACASLAEERGIQIAKENGAQVIVLTVQPADPDHVPGEPCRETERSRQVLAQVAARAASIGIEVQAVIAEGDAAREILDLASAREVDLIVIGAGDEMGRGQLGSCARDVFSFADCPVIVESERDQAYDGSVHRAPNFRRTAA